MGPMLALILTQLLAASQSCEERCAARVDRCYTSCGGQDKCQRRCDGESTSCNAKCAAESERADAAANRGPELPCGARPAKGGGRDALRPCSESEAKVLRDAMKSREAKQLFKCKDKAGNPTPCKEDKAKAEELAQELGGEKALCKDADGRPAVCADAAKKAEAAIKGGGSRSKSIDVR